MCVTRTRGSSDAASTSLSPPSADQSYGYAEKAQGDYGNYSSYPPVHPANQYQNYGYARQEAY